MTEVTESKLNFAVISASYRREGLPRHEAAIEAKACIGRLSGRAEAIRGRALDEHRTRSTDEWRGVVSTEDKLLETIEAACPSFYSTSKRAGALAIARALTEAGLLAEKTFQQRVAPWMGVCFGPEISADKLERNDRFIEEALELVQASGYTAERAHALVDYTFGRPQGEINQEVGGVMVTLAAHCLAHGVDMHEAGETELARIWTKVEQIRAKQAAKPKHSPLPQAPAENPKACPICGKSSKRSVSSPTTTTTRSMCPYCNPDRLEFAKAWTPVGWNGPLNDIAVERQRQIEVEGRTPDHDDGHDMEEMACAAAAYAAGHVLPTKNVPTTWWHNGRAQAGDAEWTPSREQTSVPIVWPWTGGWWKPSNRRRNLIKAAALIVAEIERLDRLSPLKEAAEIASALNTALAPAVSGWRPIDGDTPMDGTPIIVGRRDDSFGWIWGTAVWFDHAGVAGWVSRGNGSEVADGLGLANPTHWMPLPPPPDTGGR